MQLWQPFSANLQRLQPQVPVWLTGVATGGRAGGGRGGSSGGSTLAACARTAATAACVAVPAEPALAPGLKTGSLTALNQRFRSAAFCLKSSDSLNCPSPLSQRKPSSRLFSTKNPQAVQPLCTPEGCGAGSWWCARLCLPSTSSKKARADPAFLALGLWPPGRLSWNQTASLWSPS